MGNVSFQRQIFVSDSSVKYGWDPAFIKLKLHEKYQDSFDPTKLDEYDNYLAEIKSRTVETLPSLDRPRVTIEKANCPICGAPIYNDDKWFGRYTRTPGWGCTEGGSLHFIQWKANQICRKRGQNIPFKERGVLENA